jgi:hypothetical protein
VNRSNVHYCHKKLLSRKGVVLPAKFCCAYDGTPNPIRSCKVILTYGREYFDSHRVF